MKRISSCSQSVTMAVALTFALSACAPPAGTVSALSPKAGKFCARPGAQAQSFLLNRDPFTVYGKVLFDDGLANRRSIQADTVHAPYLRGLLASAAELSTIEIPAGTELAVTLKAACDAVGPISRLIARGNSAGSLHSYRWSVPKALNRNELKQLADADACVVGITESARYRAKTLPTDPQVANQEHLTAIDSGAAYDLIYPLTTLKPVTIAVIDTGIDLVHPDLRDVLWTNGKEIPDNAIDDDKNGFVDDVNGYNFAANKPSPVNSDEWSSGHGTHVAGLAAAQSGNGVGGSGVMGQGARIMMLNVFGDDSGAYISDIANAIRYAADNGADVINMSIGGSGRNATYESALGYAVQKGVTIVVAAGNEASEIGDKYFESPASYSPTFEGMLAVASTDSSNGALSTYSNYSAKFIEISAPGSEISLKRKGLLSTWPGGGYNRIQGTSMASPVVAGAAGLAIGMMRSRGYDPSPATVEGILAMSATKNSALLSKVQDGHALNLRAMAEFIQANYPMNKAKMARDPGVPGYVPCRN